VVLHLLIPTGKYAIALLIIPSSKTRLLQWFNFRYDLTGFLHWAELLVSQSRPRHATPPGRELADRNHSPGDAFIVYPDRENKSILSSIALRRCGKALRTTNYYNSSKRKTQATRTPWQRSDPHLYGLRSRPRYVPEDS